MYKVYILQSNKNNKYYIGYSSNLDKRIKQHNQGLNTSTKGGVPWKIIYTEDYCEKKMPGYVKNKLKVIRVV